MIFDPKKILPTHLKGTIIQLEPLNYLHKKALRAAANHEVIWQYMPYRAIEEGFDEWFEDSLQTMQLGHQITYAVRRQRDEAILGATAYYDINLTHKRLTLGYSWFIPSVWGSGVNLDTKLIMLAQAFEDWGINRIEIGTDPRNFRSYHAIKQLGATEEGLLRQHMILQDGAVSNTVIFSILAAEWPHIKFRLNQTLCDFPRQ